MDNGIIHLQINHYDSYQCAPSCLDNLLSQVAQVPVIRVYGSLVFYHQSQKYNYNTLLHVHNFYPYVYLSCDYEFLKNRDKSLHLKEVINFLEQALGLSFKNKKRLKDQTTEMPDEEDIAMAGSTGKRRFIATINICKAVPVYGYRVGHRLFYKVHFLSPLHKSRFTNLFNDGLINLSPFAKRKFHFEIYESHIPFISQFLMDFNLFSCNWLKFRTCYFRYPIIQSSTEFSNLNTLKTYLLRFLHNNVLNLNHARIGKSVLELDIKTIHILNRKEMIERLTNFDLSHTGKINKDINLSSIELSIKDILYQAQLNKIDFTFDYAIMDTDHTVSPLWSNNLDLQKLLNYCITLTNTIKDSNISRYSSTFFRKFDSLLEQYPTTFKLVDLEVSFLNLNVLKSDLYEYYDVNELFIGHESPEATKSSGSSWGSGQLLLESDDHPEALHDEAIQNDYANVEINHMSESNNTETLVTEIVLDDEIDDANIQEQSVNDSQIFYELTQQIPHKNHSSVQSNELSKEAILAEFDTSGVVRKNYPDPYYDNEGDMPPKPLVFANKRIKIPLNNDSTLQYISLDNFKASGKLREEMLVDDTTELQNWEYASPPPSKSDVIASYLLEKENRTKKLLYISQLIHPHSKSNDFKFSSYEAINKRPDDFVLLTNMLVEVHVNTKSTKLPNPSTDEVSTIFYKFMDTNSMFPESTIKHGVLINRRSYTSEFDPRELRTQLPNIHIECFNTESGIINRLVELVDYFDPDILSGFEINAMSWGYIIERFKKELNVDILPLLSRCRVKNAGKLGDRWGFTHTSTITVTGRYTLNIWRLIRKELNLNNYSFENCCYHICHREFPKFSNLKLTTLMNSSIFYEKLFALSFYLNKLNTIEFFIDSQDLLDKNVEMSRLIGIDFNSNFYRGSQFKVESILGRLCKAENFLLNSPSKTQVHYMKALEQIPLILEPDSGFYKSPLLVLDFQSLYPSIIIAYNLCYSTFLCKLHGFKPNKNPIGYLDHVDLPPMIIDLLKKNDGVNITPNGMVFVKSNIRKSVLAKMLQEILTMRINIKNFAGKLRKDSNTQLLRVLNSRQLALKLIANVTYGYTSATFSGRMPNSDIADAIVATGREILTQSIDIIEKSEYGCKVVYGDTDSLFVYVPGKTKDDAFEIGEKLAKSITDIFPDPVKLKFEKVYHPSVLLSKKRYVGNMFEYKDQVTPKFDAKGIETIRRDGIPAQQKIVEKALRILFDTSNLSEVKKYVVSEFCKILANKVVIKDFCFAKEVRYGTYKNEAYLPPGAVVAQKKVEQDERSEPQYRERVPYVVYRDITKTRLRDRCVSPEEFIESLSTTSPMRLDYDYYITKVLIPPLERIFNLMGADIQSWYREISKPVNDIEVVQNGSITNFGFIQKNSCIVCDSKMTDEESQVCKECRRKPAEILMGVNAKLKDRQKKMKDLNAICNNCVSGINAGTGSHMVYSSCVNQDCVTYYNRIKINNELRSATSMSTDVYRALDE